MIHRPSMTIGGEFSVFADLFEERFPQRRFCLAGEVIHNVNDSRGIHYYLKEGSVSSNVIHESGNKVNLATRQQGSIFPLYFSWSKTSVEMVVENVALEDCSLIIIPKRELYELMLSVPEIAIAMVDAYAAFSTFLDYSLSSALFDSLSTRVCNALYLSSKNNSEVIMTHEQLAYAIGASRSNVTRALRNLQDIGIIENKRGKIVVSDRERLLDLCSYIVKS